MKGTGGVTVSGFTENDVNATGVFVAIGPKPSGGYWSGFGKVEDQHWQADVATDPPWQDYTISAAYYYGPPGAASPAGAGVAAVATALSRGSGGAAAGVGNHKPECFDVRFQARTDDATTTSGPVSDLCGAIRPQLLRRPGVRTAVGLPTESMTS